jgi:hypothetical protein
VLDRPYSLVLVKIVLSAGKVTSVIPWISPAAYTALTSALVAMCLGQVVSRWVMCSLTRRALAIAVRAGFTAPMLGKKLVSTT